MLAVSTGATNTIAATRGAARSAGAVWQRSACKATLTFPKTCMASSACFRLADTRSCHLRPEWAARGDGARGRREGAARGNTRTRGRGFRWPRLLLGAPYIGGEGPRRRAPATRSPHGNCDAKGGISRGRPAALPSGRCVGCPAARGLRPETSTGDGRMGCWEVACVWAGWKVVCVCSMPRAPLRGRVLREFEYRRNLPAFSPSRLANAPLTADGGGPSFLLKLRDSLCILYFHFSLHLSCVLRRKHTGKKEGSV